MKVRNNIVSMEETLILTIPGRLMDILVVILKHRTSEGILDQILFTKDM